MKTTLSFANDAVKQKGLARLGKHVLRVLRFLRGAGVVVSLSVLVMTLFGAPVFAARSQVNMRQLQQAAQANRPEAQMLLAFLYANGEEGLTQDAKQAADWYLRAANQGNVAAHFRLGMLYLRGGPNLPPDTARAAQHLRQAADRNHVEAQYRLGLLEARGGSGLSPKPDRGLSWLSRAAEGGHPAARALLGAVDATIQAHRPPADGISDNPNPDNPGA